jgi:hypothetical protein
MSENSFTTGISFSREVSSSEFKIYARYPIHLFPSNFLAVTIDTRLIGLGTFSPLKNILLPSNIWNVTVLV